MVVRDGVPVREISTDKFPSEIEIIALELIIKIHETGQHTVGFKEKEVLYPCYDDHKEEIVQYKKVLWNTHEKLQEQEMPMKDGG